MDLVPFPDGSYLELISTIEPGAPSPIWDAAIRHEAGPCAWAVESDDLAAEAEALVEAGIDVVGPAPMRRERPDGVALAWSLAFVEGMGVTLPFRIQDETPRELRVEAPVDGPFAGVAAVVLATRALSDLADRFHLAHAWGPPTDLGTVDELGARIARIGDGPVLLATSHGTESWLEERLERHGEGPCAFLLAPGDPAALAELSLSAPEAWPGGPVRWLDLGTPHERTIGVWLRESDSTG